MNFQFLLWALLLILILLFLDLKKLPKLDKVTKRLYYGCFILTGILYFAVFFGMKPPMPTRFFIDNVSPWVFSMIHGR